MGFVVEYVDKERFAELASPANREAVDKAGLHVNWELCASGNRRWAIDRERGAYFFILSVIDYSGPSADFYLLSFERHPIVLRIHPGKRVAPIEVPTELEERQEEIKNAVCDALAAIGYGGVGLFNEADAIPPKFEKPLRTRS